MFALILLRLYLMMNLRKNRHVCHVSGIEKYHLKISLLLTAHLFFCEHLSRRVEKGYHSHGKDIVTEGKAASNVRILSAKYEISTYIMNNFISRFISL